MFRLRPHLQRLSWIALVAMLALALGPALARALGTGAAPAGHCAMPPPQAATPADGQPGPLQARTILDHCPLCALGLSALTLPPAAPVLAAPRPPADAACPWRLLQAPPRLAIWRRAQPRAPPPQA